MIKLSIITINYNNKAGLQKTIDSVITQTFKDFEWIIIDGGSTDGSKELIEKYSHYITYWVSEPDKGIYNAMNKGIVQANGEYLHFLNSGDYLVDSNTLRNIFIKNNYTSDIIYGNTYILSNPIRESYSLHSNHISCHDLINASICHQSSFIKNILFKKYGLYNEHYKIAADWDFFFRTIVIENCSLQYIDDFIVFYDTNGVSSRNRFSLNKEREAIISQNLPPRIHDDYIKNLQQNEIRKYSISRYLFSLLYKIVRIYEHFKYKK